MGKVEAKSPLGRICPGEASTVTFCSGTPIESKNGCTVTVDLLSKRMISFSPIWTKRDLFIGDCAEVDLDFLVVAELERDRLLVSGFDHLDHARGRPIRCDGEGRSELSARQIRPAETSTVMFCSGTPIELKKGCTVTVD